MSKIWFVTGCARGLGRSIAEAVLASGNRLVATARTILNEKVIRSLLRTRLVTGEARFVTLMASTAIAVMFSAPVIYTFAADTPLLEPHNLNRRSQLAERTGGRPNHRRAALRYLLEYRGRSTSARSAYAEFCRQYAAGRAPPGNCRTAGSLETDTPRDPGHPLRD